MPPKRPATDTPARTGGSKAKVAKTTSTRGKKNQTKTDTSRAAEADQKTSQKGEEEAQNKQARIHCNMGNKHSTGKDSKSRPVKVGMASRSFHAMPKNGSIESRAMASKPNLIPPLTPALVSPPKFNQDQCYTWFKSYTGLEEDEDSDADQIGPGGITKLCEDLGVSLEAVDMLVLAYHLQADTMPVFTKDEWIKGMSKLEIDSITKLKAAMPGLVARLKEPQHFKEFYRYIFMFAKDSEQKCMPLETACAMFGVVLSGRPHVDHFVRFLETKKPVKVINKDQWYNFLDFSESVPEDVSNYDGASSAWPVLMDEYVEWRNEGSS